MKLQMIRGEKGKLMGTQSLIRIPKEILKKLYYKDKLSSRDIAKIYDINQKSVLNWLTYYNLPRVGQEKGYSLGGIKSSKKKIRDVNLEPSKTLSYLLGVCLGDACVWEFHKKYSYGKVHQYKIKLNVVDKLFAKEFYKMLEKINLCPCISFIKSTRKNWQGQWSVVTSSKPFVKWYKKLNLDEIEKIISIDDLSKKEFIRGFYESEGSCYINNKSKNKIFLSISITNTNFSIIKLMEKLLKEMNYSVKLNSYQSKNIKRKKAYQLRMHKKNEVKNFFEEIKPVIKRSQYDKL